MNDDTTLGHHPHPPGQGCACRGGCRNCPHRKGAGTESAVPAPSRHAPEPGPSESAA